MNLDATADRLLTAVELTELTELRQRAAQLRWLKKNGITHWVSAKGNPRVFLSAVAGWRGMRSPGRVEPDFAALKRA